MQMSGNDLGDIPGLTVGQAACSTAETGVTVIVADSPAIAAVDIRGGGPGTRETDALGLSRLVGQVDAIVLAGGSVYGLAAADRVCTLMGKEGRGVGLTGRDDIPKSPIVPAAILWDLDRGDKRWGAEPPYRDLAEAAYRSRSTSINLGAVGAGKGAMAGAHKGGVGSASAAIAGGRVAALIAVNSFGSPYVPGTPHFWAAPFEQGAEFGGRGVGPHTGIADFPPDTAMAAMAGARRNTTIGVVATDIPLTRAQAARLAIMAQTGMARALRPVHAPTDGDILFVLSTGKGPAPDTEAAQLRLLTLGTAAADVVARAIARGVYAAEHMG
ncbi:hypothetical protein PB2503_08004 [Parvularcula bermudensis HTCC2503]|uniref:Peptidase T4 n=2 Tax=Parvularcula TaxID=208215 RepID=E0TH72_PARBH|nr:hypothetical protein PB2503_08004 [Parvularcula bermudensis HTCC2503]